MTVTSGSGPSLSQAVSAATNQIVGYTYDANGNMNVSVGGNYLGYDVENRLNLVGARKDRRTMITLRRAEQAHLELERDH